MAGHRRKHLLAWPALACLLLAGLAGCESDEQRANRFIQSCGAEVSNFLDPGWGPRTVTGRFPGAKYGIDVVIAAQGASVTASCKMYGGQWTGPVEEIEGVQPAPGQLYLVSQHRWLTDAELSARVADLMKLRPGEFDGQPWRYQDAGDPRVFELSGTLSNSVCVSMESKSDGNRQLISCLEGGVRRYWIATLEMHIALADAPPGLPPIPLTPPPSDCIGSCPVIPKTWPPAPG